ncbi:MAG: nicotinate (nicotinamide) nucleotide adenylyltransferase, partial [Deltaproteobacteria bacterium]|nr:nicotinate (nicotinamide) nucleotide adenylyltransferase [Deltaproteobacteria bacterium]
MSSERVGLLGGSFNPPHRGHVGMAEWVLSEGKVDQVWVIPCWRHPFAKRLEAFAHRYQMCCLAFQSLGPKVQVLDVEKKLGNESFTYRTVAHLKKENPGKRFYLLLGADTAREMDSWDRAEELKKEVGVVVIPRGPSSPVPNVSATAVREHLEEGKGLEGLLPKSVMEYI